MRAHWPWKAVLLALLAGLFLLTATPTTADDPPPPPPVTHITDEDDDGIFDDLEESMATATPGQRLDTIVVLNRPLTAATRSNLERLVGAFGVHFEYDSINGFAASLTKGQITALAKLDLVAQVEADLPAKLFLDTSTVWSGVQKARTDFEVDGNADGLATYSKNDIVIAIIDTGIAGTGDSPPVVHQDLPSSKVLAWQDFHTPSGGDPVCSTPCDPHGHGTHVSSIAAGTGAASGGTFKGVAPGAALVGVRVLDNGGSGPTSAINAGIQWVIDNKSTYDIKVFNMSLGFAGCFDDSQSTAQMVNTAVAAGLIAVVAAGNEGPSSCTIGSPGSASNAITVGAMADPTHGPGVSFGCGSAPSGGFYLACFSSRGPTLDGRIKPDIAAPGVLIRAAQAGTTGSYIDESGTSMSSPFVAGVAGLMLDANPTLTPTQVKGTIMNTAVDWGTAGKDIDYGAGRLDAFEAIRTAAGAIGTNIAVPNHQLVWGTLAAAGQTGNTDNYTINITDTSLPIAATLVMPTWSGASGPVDFDVLLLDKNGTQVGSSATDGRQETIGLASPTNGPYTLRIFAFNGTGTANDSGPGPYFFDLSAGGSIAPPVSESLTTDGATPFGAQGFGVTVDTTATGTNDVQTVQVATGPADLFIKTTLFTNDAKVWSLGASSGPDRVVWQFSTDGTSWTTFSQANALISLAGAVPAGSSRNVYLRLTTPTSTSGSGEYRAVVTVVAVAP